MKKDNIYLIGMMGAGKTTVGQSLSRKISLEFLDIDIELQKLMDMSISMIFSQYGEKRFRMIESTFFREISKAGQLVYAIGGGTILDQSNQKIIKKGISIFLDCSLDELINRIEKDKKSRPLLKDNIKKNIRVVALKNVRILLSFQEKNNVNYLELGKFLLMLRNQIK